MPEIVDVTRSEDVPIISKGTVDEGIRLYTELMHGPPKPAEDPTQKQLSVLQELTVSDTSFVDFGIWGPYGGRITRALTFHGIVMGDNMKLRRQECKGPPTYEHWVACWAVFQAGMIMLDAFDPPHPRAADLL